MQEVIYNRLLDGIEDINIEKLEELVEPAKIWNVEFFNNLIHNEANRKLQTLLDKLIAGITFEYYDKQIYNDFIKLIDIFRRIKLHTNLPELQDKFYKFYFLFQNQKENYAAEVFYIIEKLRDHIMYK